MQLRSVSQFTVRLCSQRCVAAYLAFAVVFTAGVLAQSQPESNSATAPRRSQATAEPAAGAELGSISGTVVDPDGAVIPNVKIELARGEASPQQTLSGQDGAFTFASVPPGPFRLSFSASGFATETKSGVLQEAQNYVLPQVPLVVATTVEVNVRPTEEVAAEQIHIEEQQHLLGVVPNFYVSYISNAAPLTSGQKFQLAWKQTLNPVSFVIAGVVAGAEQANNSYSGYGPGVQGYGKRYGATFADFTIGTFVGGAVFPSLLKQDPRYFYKGTGNFKSRLAYAISRAVICKGDNGHWQPSYSSILGGLAAGGISNLYYPSSNRSGAQLTFENSLIGLGGTALGNIFQEFFSRKFTPHAPIPQTGQN